MAITKKIILIIWAGCIVISFSGCSAIQNANNKQKGAVIGATGGAVLGAILGNNIGKGGNGELGAVIGGVVGGAAGVLIGNKMDKNAQRIEEEIPGAKVERVDDDIIVTFDENSGIYFDTNKYNVNSASQVILDKMSGLLKEFPDTNVLIVGHTDNTGPEDYNLTLSKQRAQSVDGYFKNKGLNAYRFKTNWFGESSPIATNATPEGRSKNRRVNIVLIPNDKMKQEAKKEARQN